MSKQALRIIDNLLFHFDPPQLLELASISEDLLRPITAEPMERLQPTDNSIIYNVLAIEQAIITVPQPSQEIILGFGQVTVVDHINQEIVTDTNVNNQHVIDVTYMGGTNEYESDSGDSIT